MKPSQMATLHCR